MLTHVVSHTACAAHWSHHELAGLLSINPLRSTDVVNRLGMITNGKKKKFSTFQVLYINPIHHSNPWVLNKSLLLFLSTYCSS